MMAIEAEITQHITLTQQEYDFVLLLRKAGDSERARLLKLAETITTTPQGTSGEAFLETLDTLRADLNDAEFEKFKQSLAVFDTVDPEAWR